MHARGVIKATHGALKSEAAAVGFVGIHQSRVHSALQQLVNPIACHC